MKQNILVFGIIGILSLIVYANSLNNSFHFDDQHYIVENIYIQKIQNIPAFFRSPRYISSEKPFTAHFRPLVVSSYAINYYLGDLNPFGYHLFNLGFHVGSACLIFLIVQAMFTPTLSLPHQGGGKSGGGTIRFLPALSAGLIFAVHPFNSEVVNYITARSSVMCAFFYLLAFYFWVRYREFTPTLTLPHRGGGDKEGRGRVGVYYYIASLLAFLLAMLSKEIAITLPFILFLYDLFFVPVTRKAGHLKRLLLYLPFIFSTVVPYLILRKVFYGHFFTSKFNRDFTVNLLTQTKVLVGYIKLLLFPYGPYGLTIDHPVWSARSFFETGVIFSSLILLGILGFALYLFRDEGIRRVVSFSILWFFVTMLPVTLIPLNAMMQENRAYLAGVGFAVVAGIGIGKIRGEGKAESRDRPSGRYKRQDIILLVLLIPLIIAYSTVTMQRNRVWKDDVTLWSDAVGKALLSPRSFDNLGLAYSRAGNRLKAEEMYHRTLQLAPDYLFAYFNLGVLYSEKGEWEKAEFYYREAIRLNPNYSDAYFNLGLIYKKGGDYDRAIEAYQKAISIDSRSPFGYNNLGVVYRLKGERERSIQFFLEAIKRAPGYFNAYYNLAGVYEDLGDYKKAIQTYEAALRIDPGHEKATERLRQLKESPHPRFNKGGHRLR